MLMKLTPGFNFINVLHAVFMRSDLESIKIQLHHQNIFTLLGSAHLKAAGRTMMKLTPGLNFINVLRTAFTRTDPKSVKRQSSCQSFLHFRDLQA